MKRLTISVVLTVSLLAGCMPSPTTPPPEPLSKERVAQLRADVQAIGDKCRSLRLDGAIPGFAASVQCSNPSILAAYEKVDFPYISLLNLALAQRLQLAERADAKKISEGDMLVEFYSDTRGLPYMPAP